MKYKGCGSNTSSAIFLSSFLPWKQTNKQKEKPSKQKTWVSYMSSLLNQLQKQDK